MKTLFPLLLGIAMLAPAAHAQNLVESPIDHPSTSCFENNCICPKNYSIRHRGTSSPTGGVGAKCEYDGLNSGGEPDNTTSRVQPSNDSWTSSVDPINPALDGTVESGTRSR